MLAGLNNVGNTCWMNASLQLLALLGVRPRVGMTHLPRAWQILTDILNGARPGNDELREAAKEVCGILPDFKDGDCNDAHEFFMSMINDSDFQQRMALELTFTERCTNNEHHVSTRTGGHRELEISIDVGQADCSLIQLLHIDGKWREASEYVNLGCTATS
jgi:hypothetical protein